MLGSVCASPLQWASGANIAIAIIVSGACWLCWHHWKTVGAYSGFPNKRMEIEWLWPIISGRYPKHIPLTSLLFQTAIKAATQFRKEGLCVLWLLKPYVLVYNEVLMKYLVNEVCLAEKATHYRTNQLIFGNGLLTSDHETWKRHRKLLSPAFSLPVLKSKIHVLNKYAVELIQKLETLVDKPIDNLTDVLKFYGFRNMADHLLGMNMTDERHLAIAEACCKLTDLCAEQFVMRFCRPWLYWDFLLPFFRSGKIYLQLIDAVNHQLREALNEIRKEQQNGESRSANTCAHILMKHHIRDNTFTEKDLRDHLLTLGAAGFETTSITMMWCFYLLGHHPEVQEKAYSEIKSVAGDGDISFEDLAGMKYLECVIKETLRLYSTVPVIGRKASKDVQCGKYTIPKGTDVVFFIFMLHRDPEVFPEPDKFDPERFADCSTLRPWMYIPFAEGYRSCIGKKLALFEMKVNIAHVLRRFRITSLTKIDDGDFDWKITLTSTKSTRFLLQDRSPKSQRENDEQYVRH